MSSHDFDINSYTIRDLEALFQLKHGKYTVLDINIKKREFYNKIVAGSEDFNDKTLILNLNTFLADASDFLTYTIRDKNVGKGGRKLKGDIEDGDCGGGGAKTEERDWIWFPSIVIQMLSTVISNPISTHL